MNKQRQRYDVDLDLVLPDLSTIKAVAGLGEPREVVLETTYFDTPDRRLAAVGVRLSRQTGGDDAGWHLSIPDASDSEATHDVGIGLGRAVRTVPRRLRTTVAGLVGDRGLAAVATVTSRRFVRDLLDHDGRPLATITDEHVDAARHTPTGVDSRPTLFFWREIEVGLADGGGRLLGRVDRLLTTASARPTDDRSKLAEVLAGKAQVPEAPRRPRDPTRRLVQYRIAALVGEIRARDPLVRGDLPEGVHTMRVAIRRLRSILATARPFLDRTVTDPVRDELAWLADALGEVRDSEVRRTRLDASIDALVEERIEVDWEADRVRSALWSPLVEQHDRALAALDVVLTSERYAQLVDRLLELVESPPWTDRAAKPIKGAYRRRTARELVRVDERMEAAHDPTHTPGERAHALHEARRATKRARYAVEPLRPIYGAAAITLTQRLKELQAVLGEHQDTVVTRDYLHALVQQTPPLDPTAALTAGALIERESVAAEHYDDQAARAWRELVKSSRLG